LRIDRYSKAAIAFHWIIAAGIVANVVLAWIWPRVSPGGFAVLLTTHKSIGVTILGLASMRLLWRLGHTQPDYPASYRPWERTVSHWAHALLYLLMFGLPLSGWIIDSAWKDAARYPMHYFYLFEWPRIGFVMNLDPATRKTVFDAAGKIHGYFGYLLYVLFVAHVAGALKHQWLDGEREIQRMWPARARDSGSAASD
jgi:cytochrome b561